MKMPTEGHLVLRVLLGVDSMAIFIFTFYFFDKEGDVYFILENWLPSHWERERERERGSCSRTDYWWCKSLNSSREINLAGQSWESQAYVSLGLVEDSGFIFFAFLTSFARSSSDSITGEVSWMRKCMVSGTKDTSLVAQFMDIN